ncbi:MAG: hypothetical protein ING19_05985, partial [Azospirillum sp.]|nr:hypothetical protein [Azospirillum sp.]
MSKLGTLHALLAAIAWRNCALLLTMRRANSRMISTPIDGNSFTKAM